MEEYLQQSAIFACKNPPIRAGWGGYGYQPRKVEKYSSKISVLHYYKAVIVKAILQSFCFEYKRPLVD